MKVDSAMESVFQVILVASIGILLIKMFTGFVGEDGLFVTFFNDIITTIMDKAMLMIE